MHIAHHRVGLNFMIEYLDEIESLQNYFNMFVRSHADGFQS